MTPARKPFEPPAPPDIPVLDDVVAPGSGNPMPPTATVPIPAPTLRDMIRGDLLADMLTERIAALTDRLLRDATAEIHATLVNKVWEKLRDEIPGLVAAALHENGHRR